MYPCNTPRSIAAISLFLALTPIVRAADIQVIKSRDGSCQVTAPANWLPGQLGATADSPDKKASLAVSSPKMVDSYAEAKQTAQTVYTHSKVTVNSPTEFIMEGKSITDHKPDVYRLIPVSSSKFCIVEVIYENGAVDQARAIAASLHGAK